MLLVSIILYALCAVVVATVGTVAFCGLVKLSKAIFRKEDADVAIIAIIMFIVVALVALSPLASRAEELPEDFYYKVVFVDEVEELEEELLLHGDDADHLWTWYEEYPSEDEEFVSFEFDKELSNLALRWAQENEFFVQLDKEERIIRGRIVVLTMWEANQEDLFDDEVIDVYFTELITH